ncbi:MAG: GC-type dockerin domain-anchored protein [Phycisphaerales bacterium]
MSTNGTRIAAMVLFSGLAAGVAHAQCDPAWDGAIGNPGIDRGYIQPMMNWDDGTGERLYVGGSFNAVLGTPGTTLLAQWDRDTNTWDRVGTPGLSTGSTNGFLTSILPFEVFGQERLVVAGFFASAGGVADTRSIAAWNGDEWVSMSADLPSPQSIWAMMTGDVGQGENLIIGGAWPEIGGVFGADLAQWDGDQWLPVGDGSGISGTFSPTVFALEMFDDGTGPALYAGGRFDSIGGAPGTSMLGRFNGTSWEAVGSGLLPGSVVSQVAAMAVFDDGTGPALYVGMGSGVRISGVPFASVYKWDGIEWSAVGQEFGGRVTDFQIWDDGSGPALYVAGTAVPPIEYLARLEGDTWVPVDGGIASQPATSGTFASVFGLHVWDNDLYVGGNFTLVGDPAVDVRGIVRRTGCADTGCYADFDGDGELTIFDFLAFQNAFDAGDIAADCDEDGSLTLFDFLCFQNAFDAGCE